MSEKQFDIYLIQDPDVYLFRNPGLTKDDLQGQLQNLYRYFSSRHAHPIYVKDTQDFLNQVIMEVLRRQGARIRNLVIGAHGDAQGSSGYFYIGKDAITRASKSALIQLASLGALTPFLAADASVYILACKTGRDQALLQKVSGALGGVKVHGYTEYIITMDYGLLVTLDDSAEWGEHFVCLRSKCTESKEPFLTPPPGERTWPGRWR